MSKLVKALPVLLIVAGLGVSGCSSNGDAAKAQTLPQAQADPGRQPAPALASASLSGKLLAVADMPTGFSVDTSTGSPDSTPSGCPAFDTTKTVKKFPAYVEAKFSAGGFGPQIEEALASASVTQVRSAFADFAKAVASCPHFDIPDSSGGTDRVSLSALSFPRFGDGTYALRMSIKSSTLTVEGDLVLVEKGNVLMLVANIGLTTDSKVTSQVVSKAYAKL